MAEKIRLKDNFKFRMEEGYVLLCNCKSLESYELPLKYYDQLNLLKETGLDKGEMGEDLMDDLEKIGAVINLNS